MNRAGAVLNGFSAAELAKLSGLTLPMVNYFARAGYLRPAYQSKKARGRVRYYSYRDLIVARILKKLTDTGLELRRLKASIRLLNQERTWLRKGEPSFDLLATDGRRVYYHLKDGSLLELTPKLQQSFAFVLDVSKTQKEIKGIMDEKRRRLFDLVNQPLRFETKPKQSSARKG